LESLGDGDLSLNFIPLKERFQCYFDSLDKIAKNIAPMPELQKAWMKAEASTLVSKYCEIKPFTEQLGVQLSDLHAKDQTQLCLATMHFSHLPKLYEIVDENAQRWLQTMPAVVRASCQDNTMRKERTIVNFQRC